MSHAIYYWAQKEIIILVYITTSSTIIYPSHKFIHPVSMHIYIIYGKQFKCRTITTYYFLFFFYIFLLLLRTITTISSMSWKIRFFLIIFSNYFFVALVFLKERENLIIRNIQTYKVYLRDKELNNTKII